MFTSEEVEEIAKMIADERDKEDHIIDDTVQYHKGPRPSRFIGRVGELIEPFGGSLAYSKQGMGGPDGSMNLRGMMFARIESEEDEAAALEVLEAAGLWTRETGFQISHAE